MCSRLGSRPLLLFRFFTWPKPTAEHGADTLSLGILPAISEIILPVTYNPALSRDVALDHESEEFLIARAGETH